MYSDIFLATILGMPDWAFYLLLCIIPFLLGWWFGTTFSSGSSEITAEALSENPEYRDLQDRLNTFEKEDAELKYKLEQSEINLDACRSKRQSIEMEHIMYKSRLDELGELESLESGDGKMIAAAVNDRSNYGSLFSSDDLQIVEGIGPKVEALLKDKGISDWKQLGGKVPAQVKSILTANKLQMMNPDSWPKQAQLAEANEWDELAEYQKFLDGGRADTGDFDTPAKIDNLAKKGGSSARAVLASTPATLDFSPIFKAEKLQIVEGIGPKVEKLLKSKGIENWEALGKQKPGDLKALLAENKLQMMNPDSWPKQAQLADQGKWDELVEYQKFLDGGRADTGDFDTPSKVEKMAVKAFGFSLNPEDLKIIEGIGPKIEGLLKEAGIANWSDLASASVDTLQGVLEKAGNRYKLAKPDTWPQQAELATKGQWSALKTLQDQLDGGRA